MNTIQEIKAAVKAGKAAGQQFQNAAGSTGTVLLEVSARGKPLAEMSCTKPGCTATHRREISDWHQSHRCGEHPANRSGKSGTKKKDAVDQKAALEDANAKLLQYAADNKHVLSSETVEVLEQQKTDAE